MPRFLEKFHHTHHDDRHNDHTASASSSSGRPSRDSKHLLAQSASPPPYTEESKNQPFGLSSEDKAAATRAPFRTDAGVSASYSSGQSDSRGTVAGPSTVRTSLQLCPHDDLTFERLQLLKGILYETYLAKGIDIIKNTKEKRHKEIQDPDEKWPVHIWACHADHVATGTFKMKLSSKPHKFFGHARDPVIGLELHICWKLEIGWASSGHSRDHTNQFLQKYDNVQLCPHRVMNDPWIQEKAYEFRTVLDVPKPNSMDQYMVYTHKSKPPPPQPPQAYDCDRCKTHVEVSYDYNGFSDSVFVKITRHLGEGIVENDPAWLAQCGIEP